MSAVKISCKEAHRLISEHMDRPLSFWGKLKLRAHLLMCTGCSRIEQQFSMLRKAMRALDK